MGNISQDLTNQACHNRVIIIEKLSNAQNRLRICYNSQSLLLEIFDYKLFISSTFNLMQQIVCPFNLNNSKSLI